MGQSPEELSTEIAGTRQVLASDLDALQDKISPAAIVDRRKQAARGQVRSVRDKVMGSAHSAKDAVTSASPSGTDLKDGATGAVSSAGHTASDTFEGSPIAAGLVAFGAGLVIAGLFPATRAETRASAKVVDAAQPLVEEAKSVGQDLGEQLKGSATESAQQVKDVATDGAQHVKDEGASSAETVRSQAPGA